jgi:hypothetical protein
MNVCAAEKSDLVIECRAAFSRCRRYRYGR